MKPLILKSWFPLVCLFLFSVQTGCRQAYYVKYVSAAKYEPGKSLPQDTATAQWLNGYRSGIDSLMNRRVAYTKFPLTKAQPESTIGNLTADALMAGLSGRGYSADAAVVNYGGIRLYYIAPGVLNERLFYEMLPFDNAIAIAEMSGSQLKQLCDTIASAGGWPVSGLKFKIREKRASDIIVNGRRLNEHIVYKIALPDFLLNGGDHCQFLSDCKRQMTYMLVRDIVIDHCRESDKRQEPLNPVVDNRISYDE